MKQRKANGLRDPIVLDGEVLIDGRCRLLACRSAGVEPRFKQLPAGTDPVDYIGSVNLMRVHLSPGQRAMQAVKIARELGNPDWCVAGILRSLDRTGTGHSARVAGTGAVAREVVLTETPHC